MFEKIKAKGAEVKQWFKERFDLNTRFGMVAADIELSAMVIGRKIGETSKRTVTAVKNEWGEFRENPKEYIKDRWERFTDRLQQGKEKVVNKIKDIGENLKNSNRVETSFADRLSNWFQNRATDVYAVEEKIAELRLRWEVEKFNTAANSNVDKRLTLMIVERINRLNTKRKEYRDKKEAQEQVGFILNGFLVTA
jgi:hypothetical protein